MLQEIEMEAGQDVAVSTVAPAQVPVPRRSTGPTMLERHLSLIHI